MLETLKPYILAFIPIFVAMDALPNVAILLGLTEGLSEKKRQKIVTKSIITAAAIAGSFMFVGKIIFRILGINTADFMIAGGILLFIIAGKMLLVGKTRNAFSNGKEGDFSIFPLATPIITGPAVLTMTLIMLDKYGAAPTAVSLVLNLIFSWIAFRFSGIVIKIMGNDGAQAFAKIADILLAAIAVMLVREGIIGLMLVKTI